MGDMEGMVITVDSDMVTHIVTTEHIRAAVYMGATGATGAMAIMVNL